MSDHLDEILPIDEVAACLKAGKRTVYRLVSGGRIPAFKLGGTWRFRRSKFAQGIVSQIGDTADLADEEGGE